jgi:plasmid stabilization system protein ParE
MRRSEFHRLARRELNDSAQYYEMESPGLGAAFLDEVERCLEIIADHPEAGAIVLGSVRRRLLRRFPYALLYSIKDDGIRVLAVMNLKRRPTYWVGRQ